MSGILWVAYLVQRQVGGDDQRFEKSDSKLASWYQLALLAAVANSKFFVQKNNRPLQVELENGRFDLQNYFHVLEAS